MKRYYKVSDEGGYFASLLLILYCFCLNFILWNNSVLKTEPSTDFLLKLFLIFLFLECFGKGKLPTNDIEEDTMILIGREGPLLSCFRIFFFYIASVLIFTFETSLFWLQSHLSTFCLNLIWILTRILDLMHVLSGRMSNSNCRKCLGTENRRMGDSDMILSDLFLCFNQRWIHCSAIYNDKENSESYV